MSNPGNIVETALQIARLKANGCLLQNGSIVQYCKSDVDTLLKYYRDTLEADAMKLLMNMTRNGYDK